MNLSFRDPDGRVIVTGNRVLRVVNTQAESATIGFVESDAFARLVEDGLVVPTKLLGRFPRAGLPLDDQQLDENFGALSDGEELVSVFEHERIPFPSYPYEWPHEMLYAAGQLTLDLAETLLPLGMGLKDATPYNVLFRGPASILVDLLSLERREPCDPTWLGYAQFVRTFIRPLLVNMHFGLGLRQILQTHRDGLNPSDVTRLCSILQKMRPPFLSLVTVPALLARINTANKPSIYRERRAGSSEKASFILGRQFKSLRRKLKAVSSRPVGRSVWSEYGDGLHYSENYSIAKREFVRRVLSEEPAKMVLDIGCNKGDFSAIAAENGARVVAIDSEEELVGYVWRRAIADELDILPLVVDWTRPTPAIGWRNQECLAFLDRARGAFDCVMMLAVNHHMLVTERIPLEEIFGLAAEVTTDRLIVEFIPPDDPKFRLIARGNDRLYEFLTRENFESVGQKYFRIESAEKLPESERWLYLMRRGSVA